MSIESVGIELALVALRRTMLRSYTIIIGFIPSIQQDTTISSLCGRGGEIDEAMGQLAIQAALASVPT
jgi:hypothetical protein